MNKELADFQQELDQALEGLEVPQQRRKLTLTNLQWLTRNLQVRNKGIVLKQAQKVIINLLRNRKQIGL